MIKLTAPGIPDFYQGSELWNFSLVDPDNRRPVDYGLRKRLLHEITALSPEAIWERLEEGLRKLWIIRQGLRLRLRRERPHAFGPNGDYSAIYANGEKSGHVISYLRGGEVITIVPRLSLRLDHKWNETTIELPKGLWLHELNGQTFEGGLYFLRDIVRIFPAALLSRTS